MIEGPPTQSESDQRPEHTGLTGEFSVVMGRGELHVPDPNPNRHGLNKPRPMGSEDQAVPREYSGSHAVPLEKPEKPDVKSAEPRNPFERPMRQAIKASRNFRQGLRRAG